MLAASLLPLLATLAAVSPTFAAPTANADALADAVAELLPKQAAGNDTPSAAAHVARDGINDIPVAGKPLGFLNVGDALWAYFKEDKRFEGYDGGCQVDRNDWKDGRVKVRCLRWFGERIVDVRRFGMAPTNCLTATQTETWTVERSETNTHEVSVSVGVDFSGFSASTGYSFTNEVTENQGYSKTLSCSEYRGLTCMVGGLSRIELSMDEFYAKPKPEECDTCLDKVEETQVNYLQRNSRKPNDWYSWYATNEDCYIGDDSYYPTT